MNVTVTNCSKWRGRLWKAIGGLFGALLLLLGVCLGAYQVSYDAKAESQDAASDTGQLKVKVDAQGDVLEEIKTDVREVRTGVAEINEFLRNGKGE